MNASDILMYGHRTVRSTIEGMPDAAWQTPGVCGVWSSKDILAHLTSYEWLLVDILHGFLDRAPTPYLDQFRAPEGNFNDTQVARRAQLSIGEVVAELDQAHAHVMELIARIPLETLRQPGTLPWYGVEYALDDLLVYMYYGHKREHCAQIAVFCDTLQHARGA
jgi:hypothetical protein